MASIARVNRGIQVIAWTVFVAFIVGFFYAPIGIWTGTILGVWFVGTQRPWRGFLLQMGITVLLALGGHWRGSGLRPLELLGWLGALSLLWTLPLLFHRLVSPRLPGLASTLPLPLCAAVFHAMGQAWLPGKVANLYFPAEGQEPSALFAPVQATLGAGGVAFLIGWFAAALIWMWNNEFRRERIGRGASLFFGLFAIAVGGFIGLGGRLQGVAHDEAPYIFARVCLGAALVLWVWSLFRQDRQQRGWANRGELLRDLRSPVSGQPVTWTRTGNREILAGGEGERYSIRDGIADFRRSEDLMGDNLKCNHLYETIGGFYDDIQRVVAPLSGFNRDTYVVSYLHWLEVKPGDAVLETSVGTGLNFKYLPRGVRLCGLDLSAEMLVNCQRNLRNWGLDADLVLGNAECLPFADASFDVVFHVGGINFFNDRGKAIREMIRVAKPGSRILIADETEEHVKAAYERGPITSSYYKERKEAVVAPVDLVPKEMLEVHLEILSVIGKNRFYALTFRKPLEKGAEAQGDCVAEVVGKG